MADSQPELSISRDKICFIALKAREFDVKDVLTDAGDASNPSDDGMISVLEDHRTDPVVRELVGFIRALSQDERADLVALAWLGRGDGGIADWDAMRAEAAREHNNRAASYLLGMPLLSDFLKVGLDKFGGSCVEFESEHL